MDSMEVNKGIAAVLVAGIVFFLTGLIGDNLVHETLPEKPALNIAGGAGGDGAAARRSRPSCRRSRRCWPPPIRQGGRAVRQEGLRRLPHLQQGRQGRRRAEPVWRGRRPARPRGRASTIPPALEKFKGQPWTFDALNEWLHKPSAYAPGTRMTFAGINNDKQRADVIAYLRTLSDNPVPLPAPEAAPPAAAAAAAPAGGRSAARQPAAGAAQRASSAAAARAGIAHRAGAAPSRPEPALPANRPSWPNSIG